MKRRSVPGSDGETWRHYGERREQNIRELSGRLKRGAYPAKPVRRAHMPKSDGRQRPLGVLVLEDKLVQRTVAEVMGAARKSRPYRDPIPPAMGIFEQSVRLGEVLCQATSNGFLFPGGVFSAS